MDAIKGIRKQIDLLDQQIAMLLSCRMHASQLIGIEKKSQKQDIKDARREAEVLKSVTEVPQHPLFQECMGDIYQTIFDVSKKAQHFLKYDTLTLRRIGIIGLGLMGGSLCKALKTKDPSIHIASLIHSSDDYRAACREGWIDRECKSSKELVDAVDLVIIATPISTVISLAQEIKAASKKLLVLDLASVKSQITSAFEAMTDDAFQYISSHPMAGKEIGGFQNSEVLLFVERPWIIVPHKKNEMEALKQVEELVRFVGAKPVYLDAEQHDKKTALISHIPSILSEAFFQFVQEVDSSSTQIAGPGFCSFTRLKSENPLLREEIIRHNTTNIQEYLKQWKEFLP
jgi:prephenate dehydrogenase